MHERTDELTREEARRLRASWAWLQPSDDLEDRMADLARASVEPGRSSAWHVWIPVAGMAAALLLIMVLKPRDEPEPEIVLPVSVPVGASDGPAAPFEILPTPSVTAVEAARKRNESVVRVNKISDATVSTQAVVGESIRSVGGKRIPSQEERFRHRWIERNAWKPGTRTVYDMESAVRRPRARVGARFVEAAKLASTVDHVVVEIRTPEKRPAITRLTVRVDRGFPGWMAVPNDVARGLGLHQFEVPGGAVLTDGHENVAGYRARARLSIAGRADFAVEQEVFVDRAPRPQLGVVADSSAQPPSTRIELVGPVPTFVAMTQGITYSRIPDEEGETGVRFHGRTSMNKPRDVFKTNRRAAIPIRFAGPVHLFLDYDDEAERRLWLPPIEIGGDWGEQLQQHVGEASWTADANACPPGSTFVAATIWRGAVASVGASGIAFGEVREGGVFKAVFPRGADLSGLRAHVTRPDGTRVWVDARLDDPGGATGLMQAEPNRPLVVLHPQGAISLAVHGQGVLISGPNIDANWLEKAFERVAPLAQARITPDGRSSLELGVVATPDVSWRQVADVLRVAGVNHKISTVRLQISGAEPSPVETIRLPSTVDVPRLMTIAFKIQLMHREAAPGQLTVLLRGPLQEKHRWTGAPRPPFLGDDSIERLRGWWQEARGPHRRAEIVVFHGVRVPAVHEALRACREAGAEPVAIMHVIR